MKNIHIDKLGRIVIPITFRRALELSEGSTLEVYMDGDAVIIRRSTTCCKLCSMNIDNDYDIGLCKSCIEKIKKI